MTQDHYTICGLGIMPTLTLIQSQVTIWHTNTFQTSLLNIEYSSSNSCIGVQVPYSLRNSFFLLILFGSAPKLININDTC